MDGPSAYDLFVSVAASDERWVNDFLIPELGMPRARILTQESFRLGVPIAEEVERAVVTSRYTLLVISPAYLADRWAAFGEQLATYSSVEAGAARLIPLVLQPVQLPAQLRFRVQLDCTSQENWPEAVSKLRAQLGRPDPEPGPEPACPYPGITAFGKGDASRFFGREELVEETVQRLISQTFLALIGPSGSGKSSFLSAGVVPALASSPGFESSTVNVLPLRPGPVPTGALAGLLGPLLGEEEASLAAELAREPAALREALERIATRGPVDALWLLVIDPFEEAFAQCRDPDERLRFFGLLDRALSDVPKKWRVIIAVRADFYDDLQESLLWPQFQAARLDMPPLGPTGLRRAVEQPAREVGVYVDRLLVDRLISDASDQRGPLPMLQATLRLLWTRKHGHLVTLGDYEALGSGGRSGLEVALRTSADATWAELRGPGQQDIARRILLRLVEFGAGRKDTRRQQPRSELYTVGADQATVDGVLEFLVSHGLVTTDHDKESGEPLVDLAHERLIEAWPSLTEWLEASEAMEHERRNLVLTATAWERHASNASYAFTGEQLRHAEVWAAKWPQELGLREEAFLEASRRADHRLRRNRLAGIVTGAGLATVVVAAATYLGWRELMHGMAVDGARSMSPLVTMQGGVARLGWTTPGGADAPTSTATFRIEKYEVSNSLYQRCQGDGACITMPGASPTLPGGDPVASVSAGEAERYCAWLGRRLPTDQEWERTVRGVNGRVWAWGDVFLPPDWTPPVGLVAVDRATGTETPDAGLTVYHLMDNVREWVAAASGYRTAGFSWDDPVTEDMAQRMATLVFVNSDADSTDEATGFRCAADVA